MHFSWKENIIFHYKCQLYFTLSPTYSICPEHGYITGEHYNCPICQAETEVYSRITGYYRPLKNWNNGKQEEFKDRAEYVLNEEQFNQAFKTKLEESKVIENAKFEVEKNKLILFTTANCPNCKMVKAFLEKEKIEYDIIEADKEINLSKDYEINLVPTLIVSKDSQHYDKYTNFSSIVRYIQNGDKQ